MLRVYVDDSADERQERVIVAGAYVGFYHQWKILRERWKKLLKSEKLSFFHTTDCNGLTREFARFRDPERYPKPLGRRAAQRILSDFETIIHETEVMGIAVCIPLEVYNEIRQAEEYADVIFPPDAFQVALITLFKTCGEIARDEFTPSEKVALICDESNRSGLFDKVFAQFRQDNPNVSQFIESFKHRDDKVILPLQAADLMAHVARKRFCEWLDDPKKAVFTANDEVRKRLKGLNVHAIQCWDRKYMMAVLDHERKRRNLVSR